MNRSLLKFILLLLFCSAFSGCGYKIGYKSKALPGGYDTVAIPVFKNKTKEVSAEVAFTNSLIEEMTRSKVAQVTSDKNAKVRILGTITSIQVKGERRLTGGSGALKKLPKGAVLATGYRIFATVVVQLQRIEDGKILWRSQFEEETTYQAPTLETPSLNSANALYNYSARQLKIADLAKVMMSTAHDRLTEFF